MTIFAGRGPSSPGWWSSAVVAGAIEDESDEQEGVSAGARAGDEAAGGTAAGRFEVAVDFDVGAAHEREKQLSQAAVV